MKRKNFKELVKYSWLLLAMLVSFSACKDEPGIEPDPEVLVEDGIYITGAGTALTELDASGRMMVAKNEVLQEDRSSLYEMYIAIKAEGGFSIVEVAGKDVINYGPASDFAAPEELDTDEPTEGLWKGGLEESATLFTVPEDGLYHVVIDTELSKVLVAKVVWGVIGAATPGGWSSSTNLTAGAFDLNEITFEGTDIELTKADWKFRYSNGWKVILDSELDLGGGDKGVKANANFGGAIDALDAGGSNIANDVPGLYSIKVVWSLETGSKAFVEKTGDATMVDYSANTLGFVGAGVYVDGVSVGWTSTAFLKTPEVSNTTYTWKWENVSVDPVDGGSFKIRDEKEDWSGIAIGYTQVNMEGDAAELFETNDDGNFVPTVAGSFDFTLTIDAATETYTFKAVAAGTPEPEIFMLGDGSPAGWSETQALPMDGTAGNYTLTVDLPGGGQIKFITVLGQWAPMYGTDADGTSESGNLVYRATEDDTDPAGIPGPAEAGSYTFTLDTNALTYTIVKN